LGGVLDKRRVREAVATNKVGTETRSLDNFVRATFAIGEFGNSAGGSVAVYLDSGHDKIANSKGNGRSGFISTFAVESAAFICE
jgi:hypothetical protein